MEAAGLGLGALGALDICLKYGNLLIEAYKAFRDAENEIDQQITLLEWEWYCIESRLVFLRQVRDSLPERLLRLQERMLPILASKIMRCLSGLESLGRSSSSMRRLQYVAIKKSLKDSITEFSTWKTQSEPVWFPIFKVRDQRIDDELKAQSTSLMSSSPFASAQDLRNKLYGEPAETGKEGKDREIFLQEMAIDKTRALNIPFSSLRCIPRIDREKWFIVDYIECDMLSSDLNTMKKNIQQLARRLQNVDPFTFGILQVQGVIHPTRGGEYVFEPVFVVPQGLSDRPESLRSHILSAPPSKISITRRLQIAKQLVKSVGSIHTFGFVHKDIRPESILGFAAIDTSAIFFFLFAFGNFRHVDGRTQRSGDSAWEQNLYRHPSRQGLWPEAIYNMQHDIYSLGVCLLEVGLWESLIIYPDPNHGSALPVFSPTVTSPSPLLRSAWATFDHTRMHDLKEGLKTLTEQRLAPTMGDRYAQIVLTCLTCLDSGNEDFGDPSEFQDADGVLVGVKYIEKVCLMATVPFIKPILKMISGVVEARRNSALRIIRDMLPRRGTRCVLCARIRCIELAYATCAPAAYIQSKMAAVSKHHRNVQKEGRLKRRGTETPKVEGGKRAYPQEQIDRKTHDERSRKFYPDDDPRNAVFMNTLAAR